MIEIDNVRLLQFYDEKVPGSLHHAAAVNAVAGEELGAGLFVHYLQRKNIDAQILKDKTTPGTRSGRRLDRWSLAIEKGKNTYYQTEIKNWSAHACRY
jgi:hypothetical protein